MTAQGTVTAIVEMTLFTVKLTTNFQLPCLLKGSLRELGLGQSV